MTRFITPSVVAALLLFEIIKLHPHIGAVDIDALYYLFGASSLKRGMGYLGLFDQIPAHTWPPGYSLLLSLFSDPFLGATTINFISYFLAIWLVCFLLQWFGWNPLAAVGLTLAVGSGFFRGLALQAKPDILTYALFLLGLSFYLRVDRLRLWAFLLWNFLSPIKLIALIFTPAALLSSYFVEKKRFSKRVVFFVFATWLVPLACVVVFNLATIGKIYHFPPHHTDSHQVMKAILSLFFGIFRNFLCEWFGSLRGPQLIPFLLTSTSAIFAYSTLRFSNSSVVPKSYAIFLLILSFLLLREYLGQVRLLGYGLIVFLLATTPKERMTPLWIIYGVSSFLLSFWNLTTVPSQGANAVGIKEIAQHLSSIVIPTQPLPSNSYYVVDLHGPVRTRPIRNWDEIRKQDLFLWIKIPQQDDQSGLVWSLKPPPDWCLVMDMPGASLFRRPSKATAECPLGSAM